MGSAAGGVGLIENKWQAGSARKRWVGGTRAEASRVSAGWVCFLNQNSHQVMSTHSFLLIFFAFFPVHPTPPQASFFPETPLSGTSDLVFQEAEENLLAGGGVLGKSLGGSPYREKKGYSFKNGARKKVTQ